MKNKSNLDEATDMLTKRLVDGGKLIEAGWLSLRAASFPNPNDQPGEIQLDEMRNAFFAGAQHLWGSMHNMLDPEAEPTEQDLRRWQSIDRELMEFYHDYVKHFVKTEGQA